MEFTAAYTIAPAHSTMTRSMAYSFATYYAADGRELDLPFGPDQTVRLARALQRGPVYCSLHRLPDDVKARLHTISPNVPLVFDRWSIDPYRDRFEVTLHNDGTIRGLGGVRVSTPIARHRCQGCLWRVTMRHARKPRVRFPAVAMSTRLGVVIGRIRWTGRRTSCARGGRPLGAS